MKQAILERLKELGGNISLSDPNLDNPTVFGTDHEVFFSEISNEGSLDDFLKKFVTKDEFVETATKDIEEFISEEKPK